MRVVIFTLEFLPYSGGIATYCYELACGLTRLNDDVTIVAPKIGHVEKERLPFRVEWIVGGRAKPALMLRGIQLLREVVRSRTPDVVLVTQTHALVAISFVGGRIARTAIPIVHGSEVLRHSIRHNLLDRIVAHRMRRFYRSRSLIICVSSYVRALVLDKFQVAPTKVAVVYNGMKNRFDPRVHRGESVRKKWRISAGSIVLLTIARLTPRKGQDVIIKALPRILERHPNVVYICAGAGAYRSALAKLSVDHQVTDYVIFPGEVEESEKYAYYDACDLFVMPSRQEGTNVEGFGLSYIEAWHTAKPVLGGRHGGVTEVIDDGVDGVLVDPEDVDSIATEIGCLIGDPTRLKIMGHRGCAKANERFGEAVVAQRLSQVLSSKAIVRATTL